VKVQINIVRGAKVKAILVEVGEDGLGPMTSIIATHRATGSMIHLTDANQQQQAFWPADVFDLTLVEDGTKSKKAKVKDPILR